MAKLKMGWFEQLPVNVTIFSLLLIGVVSMFWFTWEQRNAYAVEGEPKAESTIILLPPLKGDANLLFAASETATLLAPRIDKSWNPEIPIEPIPILPDDQLISWGNENARNANPEFGHDNLTQFGHLFPSPTGRLIAIQMSMGPMPVTWIIDTSNRQAPTMRRVTAEGYGRFMNWHPDGQHALFVAHEINVSDPGLWLIDVADDTHRTIAVPELVAPSGLTAAAFSPDGNTLIYATTRGMGTGSELWLSSNNDKAERIWTDDDTVIGSLAYSPDGSLVAFTNLLDSPVPFTGAGLWTIEPGSKQATFLTGVDGGHGQLPLWNQAGTELYFVKRDNLDDLAAEEETMALVSSIGAIDVKERKERVLVAADGARQLDLALNESGDLFFSSNRNGKAEIWAVDPSTTILRQITADGAPKRHPLFITDGTAN